MSDVVLYEPQSPAVVIRIHRPDKRGALSRELITALDDAFTKAFSDDSARVIILSGTGSSFCSGMDLDELRATLGATSDEKIRDDAFRLSQLYDRIYRSPKPTIAAINGHAVAGGAGLVTVCDLAISVPSARFGYPEVRRGLVAAMVMPHLLRHVGERAARWLLLTGDLIDASEAKRCGLINEIVEPESLMSVTMSWAKSLAEGGPLALSATKQLLHQLSHQAMSVEETAKASASPRLGDECRQGLTAFFEKKPTPWSPGVNG